MSDSNSNGAPYGSGVYVKGNVERVATSASSAVALVFDGYALKDTVPSVEASYADLQAQAKALNIPANQSTGVLREAIGAKAEASVVVTDPETPAKPVPTPPPSR